MATSQKILDMLEPLNLVWVGTVETNAPRVRPMILIVRDGMQYIATGEQDAKTPQLDANPSIEWAMPILADGEPHGSLRASGTARRVIDPDERAAVHAAAPFIARYFPLPTDPDFALFRLDITHYELMAAGTDTSEKFEL